jgi:hypothetical protein
MNNHIKFSFKESNQGLLAQYEKLRAEALDKSKTSSNRPLDFSIFLFRGMANWIETWLHSGSVQANPCLSKTNTDHQPLEETSFSHQIYKEATMILTNMVLSHQKEPRNNYA